MKRAVSGDAHEVVIEAIGARGDGVARRVARIFVPLTVPGDRLRVRIVGRRGDGLAAEPIEWLEEAPRALPPCPHFGACGGCHLQHVPATQYLAWKHEQVKAALAKQGLHVVPIEPLETTPPGARRRARFAFERRGAAVRLGFRERSGHRVIALRACPVLAPALVAVLPSRPGGRARPFAGGAPCDGIVQPRDLRARCSVARRRRLPMSLGATGQCVLVVEPDRAGGGIHPRARLAPERANGSWRDEFQAVHDVPPTLAELDPLP